MPSTPTPLRLQSEAPRILPYNVKAEQALIGAIFINNSAYGAVAEFLLPEHFGEAVHGRIFNETARLINSGATANPVTLQNLFADDTALQTIGGSQYLVDLAVSAVTVSNAVDYGRVIYDTYVRRQLIGIGQDVVDSAYRQNSEDTSDVQLERAEQRLFDLATKGAERSAERLSAVLVKSVDIAETAYKRWSGGFKTIGVTTGLTDLDRKLGGLHPSDVVIVAGRPGMGKTALGAGIAFNAAKDKVEPTPAAIFSLEMSSEQLGTRILSEETGISSDLIRRGDIEASAFDAFLEAQRRLQRAPLYIDDTPALTVGGLRIRARRLVRHHGVKLIVVDYLQLMQGAGKRNDNRVQEISEITRQIKALAKDLNVPILALSQLNRSVEHREDKRPMLADLRDSGTIEQDADVVMFLFREEYYRSRPPLRREDEADDRYNDRYEDWQQSLAKISGIAEVIIAKQRHGPTGTIKLRFNADTTKFEDFVDDRYDAYDKTRWPTQ